MKIGSAQLGRLFARLRWRMLRGSLRTPGAQRWTVLIGLLASVFLGVTGAVGLAVAGQLAEDGTALFVIAATGITLAVVALGVVAGISQPIDPRVLATEPLSDRQLATGLLVGSASGPPGLSGGLVAFGMFVGGVRGISSVPVVALASIAFAATLLLASRSTINALGLFATRFPRAGQIVVGIMSLVIYGGFQFAPRLATGLDGNEQQRIASVLQYTPPGQLGRAIENAEQHPLAAVGHLVLGALWLPALGALFVWTTRALIVAVQRPDATGADRSSKGAARRQPIRSLARWACGRGAMGALAWRSVLTRLRTPRTALETFTGAGVGLAIVLVPALLRDEVGAGAVLVGGAVQLAVLFIAGNSFGSDGPALSNELLCGVDPVLFVRAKARSVLVVTFPLVVVGPLLAASVSGEWRYLPAGFLVGASGLLAGTGGAMVQSTIVPIAIPEGDNPLAGGDSGKGCLAGLILAAVVMSLAVVTLPVALGLFWAVSFGSLFWVTVFAGATVAAGAGVLELGIRYATRHWRRSEPEIYAAVIPTS
ncbi:hypothetical protein [uncultured Ilumatobacter sp.]|uniref:hypothetical protein n=1 Tax=uncultured Ilumatobacter sp. TaxID=879968 RepID=UPI00374E816E